jgi:hypothetical protein
MKAVAAPLAALDGNALPLDVDAGEGDDAAPGEDFDALLARANAQASKGPAPVKALAPSVGAQPGASEVSEGVPKGVALPGKPVKLPFSANHADVGPTQAFLPWLRAELPVPAAPAQGDVCAPEAPASSENASLLDAELDPKMKLSAKATLPGKEGAPAADLKRDAKAPLNVTATAPGKEAAPVLDAESDAKAKLRATTTLPGKDAAPVLAERPAAQVADAAPESEQEPKGPTLRKASARERDALKYAAEATPANAVPLNTAPQLAPPVLQAKPNVPATLPTSTPSAAAPSAPAVQPADASAPSVPMVATPPSDAGPDRAAAPGFEQLLAAQPDQTSPAPRSAPIAIPMSNKDTGAVVTKIEFYETPASAELAAPEGAQLPAEPKLVVADEAPRADVASSASEAQGESDARSEREPEPQPAPAASAPRFEITEGKGMRGLDAVVASLLRPYQEKPEGKQGARVATASAPHISVETGKSQHVKVEEHVANVAQALDAAAVRREDEQRRGEVREVEAGTPHFTHHVELPVEAPALSDVNTPPPAPTANVPAPPPDPDAALMGKLARGESMNAAVSIEHPELGSMDVVVESANGRIDVRATLDTPRAAAVLRAHESALRYGVQQAGLTFGALRVNARTGETKSERSRDALKRRRDRDWEA